MKISEVEISTTMGFIRILTDLLSDKTLGKYIVPVVPESRTFGMESSTKWASTPTRVDLSTIEYPRADHVLQGSRKRSVA